MRICLISGNNDIQADMKKIVYSMGNIFTYSNSSSGTNGLNNVISYLPEYVFLDISMPDTDGLALLEKINLVSPNSSVIIITVTNNSAIMEMAKSKNILDYIVYPVSIEELSVYVKALASKSLSKEDIVEKFHPNTIDLNCYKEKKSQQKYELDEREIDEKLSNVFISIGIPPHIRGYHYLREGIKIAIRNPLAINNITKILYPQIAERFDSSSSKVERAIRHAIEVAWNRGKVENLNHFLGVKVYSNTQKPTNGEFIALIADKLLLEGA